jgi:hypothetical protein
MQKINNKAVANIVATVSILLLTIVLVSILSANLDQFLATPQLAPAMSCLEMQTSFPLSIQKVCYNPIENQTEITVNRKLDTSQIIEFDFLLTHDAETSVWCVGEDRCETCDLQPEGQTKTYYLKEILDTSKNNKVGIVLDNCLIQTKPINPC